MDKTKTTDQTDAPQHTYTFQVTVSFPVDDYIPTGIPGRAFRGAYHASGSRTSSRRRSKGCKRACQGCGWHRQGRCQAGHQAR